MDPRLQRFLSAIDRIGEPPPADLVSALRELPEPEATLSPWEAWTLIGLVRHRKRQWWVAEIIRHRLRGSLTKLRTSMAFGHPEGIPWSGPVPGLPDWEYRFHGRGCCLSHKVDGDCIDVDFFEDSAEYFCTWFYEAYLKSVRRPEPVETRLRELHPSTSPIQIAIADLLEIGAVVPFSNEREHAYRLADDVLTGAGHLEFPDQTWSREPSRVWIAALLGDWLAADEAAAGQPEQSAITGPRAARCRELRRLRLRQELGGTDPGGADAIRGLADLASPDLDEILVQTLHRPPDARTCAAVDVLVQRNDPAWCPPLSLLMSRLRPNGPNPEPHLWTMCLKFLIRHGHRREQVMASLTQGGAAHMGEAVLLALENAPERALPLIRQGLLSTVPLDRTDVAAILTLMDAPWSRRELLRALDATDDQERSADTRAALLESGREEDRQAVLAWEAKNPHEPERGSFIEVDGRTHGPLYTVGHVFLSECPLRLRAATSVWHERVMNVRHVIPSEPARR